MERATGVRKDDTRSDIYFLGCIFYHMLTGQAPLSETKDRLQRLSKQRFLEVVPDPERRSVAAALGDAGGQQGDDARPYAAATNRPRPCLADLHIAGDATGQPGNGRRAGVAAVPGNGRPAKNSTSVMVVESNQQMQDVFRDGFKKAGYRVLVTSDPVARRRPLPPGRHGRRLRPLLRPGTRRRRPWKPFNQLGEDPKTKFVRAILLLDQPQREWEKDAVVAAHRKVLSMPITMKQLRTALADLMGDQPES